MARPSEARELDQVVVPIAEAYERSMDEWLVSLRRRTPTRLPVSVVDLLDETRVDSE